MLVAEAFDIRVLTLDQGFDPDLYIRRKGKDAYADALRHSHRYFDYLIERARAQFPARTGEGMDALLAAIGARAEKFYQSGRELLPLIDRESRPALWVLVSIYHGLLRRIERAEYDVFSQRAAVPTSQKLRVLALGLARMSWARLVS